MSIRFVFCRNCQTETERYASGGCKHCSCVRARATSKRLKRYGKKIVSAPKPESVEMIWLRKSFFGYNPRHGA